MGVSSADPTLALYLKHRGSLVNYANGIVRDRAGAEDVVQEAYLRFSSASSDERLITSPVSYLYRIVRNLALDWVHRTSDSASTGQAGARAGRPGRAHGRGCPSLSRRAADTDRRARGVAGADAHRLHHVSPGGLHAPAGGGPARCLRRASAPTRERCDPPCRTPFGWHGWLIPWKFRGGALKSRHRPPSVRCDRPERASGFADG